MNQNSFKRLAERLDALPNGFPPTDDGAEARLLAHLFTPEEADLAAQLRVTLETPKEIAARIDGDSETVRTQLKGMRRKGLINAKRTDGKQTYGLLPFVIGIYENQAGRIDAEMARLFEDYYRQAFGQSMTTEPQAHRVIPVGKSITMDIEVQPFESATDIVANAQAWGVIDCICRTQKSLIGEPCEHPVDICMVLSQKPRAFDRNPVIRAQTREESLATLQRAADAGLVHSVSNNQQGLWYICNCCSCSCGFLRGMADLGIANVMARSAFINTVDKDLCYGCELCLDYCQFDALSMENGDTVSVHDARCVGCGVCVPACPDEALKLMRRPAEEVLPPPVTEMDWGMERAAARGLDIAGVL